jgi:hypothetical protein
VHLTPPGPLRDSSSRRCSSRASCARCDCPPHAPRRSARAAPPRRPGAPPRPPPPRPPACAAQLACGRACGPCGRARRDLAHRAVDVDHVGAVPPPVEVLRPPRAVTALPTRVPGAARRGAARPRRRCIPGRSPNPASRPGAAAPCGRLRRACLAAALHPADDAPPDAPAPAGDPPCAQGAGAAYLDPRAVVDRPLLEPAVRGGRAPWDRGVSCPASRQSALGEAGEGGRRGGRRGDRLPPSGAATWVERRDLADVLVRQVAGDLHPGAPALPRCPPARVKVPAGCTRREGEQQFVLRFRSGKTSFSREVRTPQGSSVRTSVRGGAGCGTHRLGRCGSGESAACAVAE